MWWRLGRGLRGWSVKWGGLWGLWCVVMERTPCSSLSFHDPTHTACLLALGCKSNTKYTTYGNHKKRKKPSEMYYKTRVKQNGANTEGRKSTKSYSMACPSTGMYYNELFRLEHKTYRQVPETGLFPVTTWRERPYSFYESKFLPWIWGLFNNSGFWRRKKKFHPWIRLLSNVINPQGYFVVIALGSDSSTRPVYLFLLRFTH